MFVSAQSRTLLFAICGGLLSLFWLTLNHQQHVALPKLAHFAQYQCQTNASSAAKSKLSILTFTNYFAQEWADDLCRNSLLSEHFSQVLVSWQPRGELTAQDLIEQKFDLLWSRDYVLAGLLPDYADFYRVHSQPPAYSIYWLSQHDKPILSQAYFANKQVGLLRDQHSKSGYQLPLAQLKQAGIELSAEQLIYFEDRRRLQQAFLQQDIDLMPGMRWQNEGQSVTKNHRLLIAANQTSGAWYIRNNMTSDVSCEIEQSMQILTPLYQKINPNTVWKPTCQRQ